MLWPVPVFVHLLLVVLYIFIYMHLNCTLMCFSLSLFFRLCLTWSELTKHCSWMLASLRTNLFPLHLVNLSILGTSLIFTQSKISREQRPNNDYRFSQCACWDQFQLHINIVAIVRQYVGCRIVHSACLNNIMKLL